MAVSRAKRGPMGDRYTHHLRPATVTHKWRVVHFDAIPDPRIGPTVARSTAAGRCDPISYKATGEQIHRRTTTAS
jgi:hypothetical protein